MTLTVIAGSANVPLETSISEELGVKPHEGVLQRFPDGELHVDIEESIRGHDVYVMHTTSLSLSGRQSGSDDRRHNCAT